jgi:hypothetical protein
MKKNVTSKGFLRLTPRKRSRTPNTGDACATKHVSLMYDIFFYIPLDFFRSAWKNRSV